MTPTAYAFLGLTGIVAALVAVVAFAMMKFVTAARDTRRKIQGGGVETALLSAALQDAVAKLKAQERATAARAEASERLSEEIISSLTAGLLKEPSLSNWVRRPFVRVAPGQRDGG